MRRSNSFEPVALLWARLRSTYQFRLAAGGQLSPHSAPQPTSMVSIKCDREGVGLGNVILKIQNRQLANDLAQLPLLTDATSDVVVTDRISEVTRAGTPVAFVAGELSDIIRVISVATGILVPSDVTTAHLTLIARGSHVYSTFTADELGIDSMEWTMVSLAARGIRPAESAPMVGYSQRTIRRKLNHFSRPSPAGHFEWIRLAPLFPTDGSPA